MKTIRDRLYNWAQWSNGGPKKGAASNTAFICDRMRAAAVGELHAPAVGGGRLSSADAELVERAWKTLLPKYRELLRWHYIRDASPGFICRRLGIKPRPTSVFDIELARSEAAIDRALADLATREAEDQRRARYGR